MTSNSASPNHTDYVPYLDILTALRGLFALIIVLYHARLFFPLMHHPSIFPLLKRGYLGVEFFFILSGFVLTHVYGDRFKNITSSNVYRSFMMKRIARIYPLHLFTLLVSLGCALWLIPWRYSGFTSAPDRVWSFITHMLMLNSVHLTSNLSWNIPAWAIGAEFLTYAVFPQILWISRIRTKIAIILYLCSLVFLAVLAEKLTKGANLDMTWDYGFMRCLIEFTGGVILYNLYLKGRYQWVLFSDMALIVSLAVTLAVLCFFEGHDLLVVPAYGALIVTAAANQGKLKNLLSSKLLKLFGEISYAIYLVHWLMLWVFFDVATRLGLRETLYAIHGWGQFVGPVVYLLAVLIVSFLLHRWLEKPMRERINKMSFARPLAP